MCTIRHSGSPKHGEAIAKTHISKLNVQERGRVGHFPAKKFDALAECSAWREAKEGLKQVVDECLWLRGNAEYFHN